MKTKLSKILGISLTLLMVFSLAGAFMPAKQVEAAGPGTTPNMWQGIASGPSAALQNLRAGDVVSLAVAPDGKTLYAVDGQTAGVFFSTNNGRGWTTVTAPAWTAPVRFVAVAPDNPQAIAVVDSAPAVAGTSAYGAVWISNNGGLTWAVLARLPDPTLLGTDNVTSIAIGPTRAGTFLGRDYAVTVADGSTPNTTGGSVFYIGLTYTWTNCAPTAFAANTYDFTSVAFSPGFLGDRTLVAVGSDNATGLNDTYLITILTSDVVNPTLINPPGIRDIVTTTTEGPGDWDATGATAGCIITSSIALPMDYDPTTGSARRVFVGWTSVNGPALANGWDDVYRIDNTTVRALNVPLASGIWSIAYNGGRSGGTLIAGERQPTLTNTVMVWYANDPQVSQPSWMASDKPPTGRLNCVVGIDRTNAKLCYAGTSGIESAFSWSQDGGISFNGRAFIDTAITLRSDVMLSPDGKFIYLATANNAGSLVESLWRSATPSSGSSWERICISPNGTNWGDTVGDSIIRLSPDFLTDNTLWWIDAGATFTAAGSIQRSTDTGQVFRSSPAGAPAGPIDVVAENKDTLYLAARGTGNVYKSINGGWYWDLPVATGCPGSVYDLEMAPSYPDKPIAGYVLLGSTGGGVLRSTNGGAAWAPMSAGNAAMTGGNTQVLADKDIATNNTVYAASSNPGAGIFRYVIGVSTIWEQILTAGAPSSNFPANGVVTGLAMSAGVLYGSWTSTGTGTGTATAGDAFSIIPTAATDNGTITVNGGSLLATGSAGARLAGLAIPAAGTAIAAGVTDNWTFAAATDWITFTNNSAAAPPNTFGTYTIIGITPGVAITSDADGDAAVSLSGAAGVGTFSLPDAAVAAGGATAVSGVERSLVPAVPVIANWTFETMDAPAAVAGAAGVAATFNAAPNALRVANTGTSVNLYAISNVGTGAVMAYDDTMAMTIPAVTVPASVAVDSVSGRNQQFTISWKAMSNATTYEVEIYSDAACSQLVASYPSPRVTPWYTASDPNNPTVVVAPNTLVSGADYYVRLRARNQMPGDAIRSNYNAAIKLTVQVGARVEMSQVGPVLLSPPSGIVNTLRPGFSWTPMPDATSYQFILATDSALTKTVGGTPATVSAPTYGLAADLAYSTTYFWAVKVTAPTAGVQSVGSFTTMAQPAAPTPPVVVEQPQISPAWIWAVVIIGAILVIVVIFLIVSTRRTP